MASTKRMLQVSEEIRTFVAGQMASGKVTDPRVKGVSIHRVRVTPDLGIAKIYYGLSQTQSTPEHSKNVSKGLENVAGFLRHKLAQQLKLRFVPEIRFYFDDNFAHAVKINDLLAQIKTQEAQIENAPSESA